MLPSEKNTTDLQNKMWYVIKHDDTPSTNINNNQQSLITNFDYFINRDDIIKLGRVKYSINEIHFTKNYTFDIPMDIEENTNYEITELNKNTLPVFNFIYSAQIPNEFSEDKVCKICYHETHDIINPLVNICNLCSGGIKYSHYECLKKWMKTKLNIKENEFKTVQSYNIKSYNCEICKSPYPCMLIKFLY